MYCRYCGKKIDEDSLFCRYCGKQIRDSSNTKVVDDASKTDKGGGEHNSGQKRNRWVISRGRVAISLTALIVIVVLFTVYMVKRNHGYIKGHEWVDLGLSVKWATCNVGAASPSDSGDYFAWGEIKNGSNSTRDNNSPYDKSVGSIAGDPKYDVARVRWGGSWRLPTKEEIDELITKCEHQRTRQNGCKGYKIIGPNGNSIFLPTIDLDNEYYYGGFWSGTPIGENSSKAYCLEFAIMDFCLSNANYSSAWPVRPVTK